MLISVTFLFACTSPRFAVDFESYENSQVTKRVTVNSDFDHTWRAIKKSADDIKLVLITEDKVSGVLAYTKPDKRWKNTAFELTVLTSSNSPNKTEIQVRGFVYSTQTKQVSIVRVWPSKGEIEKDFLTALNKRLQ